MHEAFNKMNRYNLSVTIGSTIFRPKVCSAADLAHCSLYYELLQRMMEKNTILFDKDITQEDII